MSTMPKKFPPKFKRNFITVSHRGDLSVAEVAVDFGAVEESVHRCMKQADVNDGIKDCQTSSEEADLVQMPWPMRRLKMEIEFGR